MTTHEHHPHPTGEWMPDPALGAWVDITDLTQVLVVVLIVVAAISIAFVETRRRAYHKYLARRTVDPRLVVLPRGGTAARGRERDH